MFWPSVHSCCGGGGGGSWEKREKYRLNGWGGEGDRAFSFGTVTEYMMPRGGGAIGARVSRTRALPAGGDSLRSPTANCGYLALISRASLDPEEIAVSEDLPKHRLRRRTMEPLGIEESLKINQRISTEFGQPLILILPWVYWHLWRTKKTELGKEKVQKCSVLV